MLSLTTTGENRNGPEEEGDQGEEVMKSLVVTPRWADQGGAPPEHEMPLYSTSPDATGD